MGGGAYIRPGTWFCGNSFAHVSPSLPSSPIHLPDLVGIDIRFPPSFAAFWSALLILLMCIYCSLWIGAQLWTIP